MTWNPEQYLKFESERFAPFEDLIRLVDRRSDADVIDLGCGTGELTLRLAGSLPGSRVLGIDNSEEMLQKAQRHIVDSKPLTGGAWVEFKHCSIEELFYNDLPKLVYKWDLIFSNAAIHWVSDHDKLFKCFRDQLKPQGQLAIQMPSGVRNRAQRIVMTIAGEEPYLSAMNGWLWEFPVLPVDDYVEILFNLGFERITAFEKVYPHVLESGEAVYEWVSGTTINAYLKKLPESLHSEFKLKVRKEVIDSYPGSPVIYPFRRIFISGVKPG